MNIVFRADASVRIGTGHVMRCLTLADALAIEGHDCTFVTKNHPGHLADLIQRGGHRVALMEPPAKNCSNETGDSEYAEWLGASWQADAEETIALLQGSKADWLIVDHYAIDHRWHKVLRPAAEKILVVDDLANRALDCEVLLNQNYGCREDDYRRLVRPNCLLLLGPCYALLRPEFSQLRPKAIENRKAFQGIRRILVSMGGTDADNSTSLVLQALAGVDWPKPPEIDVVLNSQAPHRQSVIESARQHPLAISVDVDVNDMAERMLRADLAIGAGGATTWERCCLGLPSLVMMTANNQNFTIQTLHEFGVVISLGPKNDFISDIFVDDIEVLKDSDKWQEMSRRSFAMTDGLGCLEVSHSINNISGPAGR